MKFCYLLPLTRPKCLAAAAHVQVNTSAECVFIICGKQEAAAVAENFF